VPYTISGGFVSARGQVFFVTTGAADLDAIRPGATVRLSQNGIVLRSEIGEAVIGSDRTEELSVPLSAFAPVRDLDSLRIPASGFPLVTQSVPPNSTGLAEVTVGHEGCRKRRR
jgi:putative peptide zinc metalloprotease protein